MNKSCGLDLALATTHSLYVGSVSKLGLGETPQYLKLVCEAVFILTFCYFTYHRCLSGVLATLALLPATLLWFLRLNHLQTRSTLPGSSNFLRRDYTPLYLSGIDVPVPLFWRPRITMSTHLEKDGKIECIS